MLHAVLRRCVAFCLVWWLTSGCLHTGYLIQAAYGQDEIASKARPIDEVLRDRGVPAGTRRLLSMIADVKAYGEKHGLEPTDNYEDYVALDRPAVVWVVTAAHPLRFEPKTWSFPIVGSVPYLGWFNRRDAERYARQLYEEGWDVDLRGASAYSTLGWFDDPILSSMIRDRAGAEASLINVVLHESVHATHFVGSQSTFNESLADFVADELTVDYLVDELGYDSWKMLAFEERLVRGRWRAERFHQTYLKLEAVYQSQMSDAEKLSEKRRLIAELQRETRFSRPLNNAILIQSRTYHGGVPELERLLDCLGGDWQRFWQAIGTIEADAFDEPQQQDVGPVIAPLLERC